MSPKLLRDEPLIIVGGIGQNRENQPTVALGIFNISGGRERWTIAKFVKSDPVDLNMTGQTESYRDHYEGGTSVWAGNQVIISFITFS